MAIQKRRLGALFVKVWGDRERIIIQGKHNYLLECSVMIFMLEILKKEKIHDEKLRAQPKCAPPVYCLACRLWQEQVF